MTSEEIIAIKKEILSSLHCAIPGTVESFDASSGTAVIRPANPRMPLLPDVPVYLPSEQAVASGDLCLVVFADYDMDSWLEGREEPPPSGRTHSLSDAFAFVGFRRKGGAP